MQVRTYVGILLGLVAVVVASFLATLNRELLNEPFRLSLERSVPLYGIVVLAFLIGLLPSVTVLLFRSLQQDLSLRRARRRSREASSLDHRFRRAVDLDADGQWSKAASELDIVLTDKPDDFAALLLHGETLRLAGRVEEALDVHRRASVLYPQSVALLYQLADDYQARGEVQVAHEIRNRILRDFPDLGLAVMCRRRDQAVGDRSWVEADQWQEKIDQFLRDSGEKNATLREAEIAQGLEYQRGVVLLEKDRYADAAAAFRKLIEREPRFVPAGIMLGEAELLDNNEEAAIDEWRRGFLRTLSPVFLKRLEDYFIEAGEPARAIETLRGLIARTDSDLVPRFFLGRLYDRLEMHDESIKILEGIGEEMDASPSYHYLLARIHQRRGQASRAAARYQSCLQRLGLSGIVFVCANCQIRYSDWQDRCDACGAWNSVDLDLREEMPSTEGAEISERPVWSVYGSASEPDTDDASTIDRRKAS